MRRVYRAVNSTKVFYSVFLTFSLLCSVGIWKGISNGTNPWFELTIVMVLVLVGAFATAQTFTARVVLSDDCIRIGSVFRSQSMRFDQIRYRREYEEYHDGPEGGVNVSYLELIPHDGDTRSLKIEKDDFNFDRAFWDWMISIPDIEHHKP